MDKRDQSWRANSFASRHARRQKRRNPRPERVELEHVTEIARCCKSPFTDAYDIAHLMPGEWARSKRIRTIAIGDRHQNSADESASARGQDHRPNASVWYCSHQVGCGLADSQGSDDDPDCQASLGPEPGCRHLHRRRIDAGEEEPGQKAHPQSRSEARRGENRRVCDRTEEGRGADLGGGEPPYRA